MRFQKSSILGFLFLTMIIIALPLTIFVAQHSQDNRQHAATQYPNFNGIDYNLFLRELSVQKGDGGNPTSTPTTTPTQSIQNTPTPQTTPTPLPIGSSFAQICGTQICINGKPYHIHGATAYGQYANAAKSKRCNFFP